jgi:Xaa-Pro aminopeptidase
LKTGAPRRPSYQKGTAEAMERSSAPAEAGRFPRAEASISMNRLPDEQRLGRIRAAFARASLDGILCALPENVLLLSGYWPVVGNALALANRDGRVAVVAPEDETQLAGGGWADELRRFRPVTLGRMGTSIEAVRGSLAGVAEALGLKRGRIGYEAGPFTQPASYSAMFLYGEGVVDLLGEALPSAEVEPADELLRGLTAVLTPRERGALRVTCRVAERAFRSGSQQLRPGLLETEAAVHFRALLFTAGTGFEGVGRADGFAWCMSGPSAAEAGGAYARSRARPLRRGDLVLMHCNSYADGYWVDVTRTYSIGEPGGRRQAMFEAVFAAREAALAAARPGVKASEVDRAARDVLAAAGFSTNFTHPTGHGVGFAAIDPHARPRIHPASDDVLEDGMVFNIEPAVYFEGDCGLRHCDVVALAAGGPEVLTPFQATIEELIIP